MENNIHPDHELEKSGDLTAETPEGQTEEPVEEIKKEESIDPIKKIQDELAEAKDKYLRLYAEFDNFRRRSSKEKLEMIQTVNNKIWN